MRLSLLSLIALAAPVAADDAPALRARAALALAFADTDASKPPGYADLHARAVRDGLPLVVWVGQPARPVPGCLTLRDDRFPAAEAVAVVVGVPAGGALRRIDLPGRPTDAAVRAATRAEVPGGTAMLPGVRSAVEVP